MRKVGLISISLMLMMGLFTYGHVESVFSQEKGKVIELKFNDWGPPGTEIGKIHLQAAKLIEERTNGRVKVNCYFSQSLLKYPETFKGVSSGIADISLYVTQPIHDVNRILSMPFTGLPNMLKTAKVFREMIALYPAFNQEFEKSGVKWISVRAMPATHLHLVRRPVKIPQDMNGMRIIADPILADQFRQVTAAVIQSGPADWHSSLERGVAEGQMVDIATAHEYKLMELFKHHTLFGGAAGASPIGFVVNIKMWNSLPPDIQKIIIGVYDWANNESLKYDSDLVENAIAQAKQAGHTITILNPSEIQIWIDWARPAIDKVLAEIESKGQPARKIFEGFQRRIKLNR
jgi:TRAP-type C4-dicarboxylate transport system substrate-binding protein